VVSTRGFLVAPIVFVWPTGDCKGFIGEIDVIGGRIFGRADGGGLTEGSGLLVGVRPISYWWKVRGSSGAKRSTLILLMAMLIKCWNGLCRTNVGF